MKIFMSSVLKYLKICLPVKTYRRWTKQNDPWHPSFCLPSPQISMLCFGCMVGPAANKNQALNRSNCTRSCPTLKFGVIKCICQRIRIKNPAENDNIEQYKRRNMKTWKKKRLLKTHHRKSMDFWRSVWRHFAWPHQRKINFFTLELRFNNAPSGCTWYVHICFPTQKCGRAAAPPHCILACVFFAPAPNFNVVLWLHGWVRLTKNQALNRSTETIVSGDVRHWNLGRGIVHNHNVGIFRVKCFVHLLQDWFSKFPVRTRHMW